MSKGQGRRRCSAKGWSHGLHGATLKAAATWRCSVTLVGEKSFLPLSSSLASDSQAGELLWRAARMSLAAAAVIGTFWLHPVPVTPALPPHFFVMILKQSQIASLLILVVPVSPLLDVSPLMAHVPVVTVTHCIQPHCLDRKRGFKRSCCLDRERGEANAIEVKPMQEVSNDADAIHPMQSK